MQRFFDLFLCLVALVIFIIPIILIAIIIRLTAPGPILFWANRYGMKNQIFKMPKFRTMLISTPIVASDLLINPNDFLTPVGGFLRKWSLDELPQLWSVFKGDMSFVGPRPALYNQFDLIELRTDQGISDLLPGITGWAQVNGRDELDLLQKVAYDREYLMRKSLFFDCYILCLTVMKVFRRQGISH